MPKQIITISGDPGSGKSTIAQALAKKIKAKRIYIGKIRRKIAKDKKMTLAELNQYALTHPETDVDVDKMVAKQARQLAQNSPVIVEGRVQFYFLPESLKVYITVSIAEGAKRIWNSLKSQKDKKERNEGEFESIGEVEKSIKQRINNDKKRYKKYYNLDHTQKSHYDLIIDTTNLNKQQAIKKTIAQVESLTKTNK